MQATNNRYSGRVDLSRQAQTTNRIEPENRRFVPPGERI
jgi:hypothetical protein